MGTRNQSKAQISSIHTLPVKIINSLMTVYDNRNNEIQIVVSYKMKQESWCFLDLCISTCFLSFFYLWFIFHIWFSIFFVIFRPVIFLSNYYFYLFRMVVCTLWTFAVLLALPAVPAYTYEEVCDRIHNLRFWWFGEQSYLQIGRVCIDVQKSLQYPFEYKRHVD